MPLHLLSPGCRPSTAILSHGSLTRVSSGSLAAPLDPGPSIPAQHFDEVLDSSLSTGVGVGGLRGAVLGLGAWMIRGCLDQIRGMVEPQSPA